jgi:hypothetical protein
MFNSDEMNDLKDHLVQISAQIYELKRSLARLENHAEIKEALGVATEVEISCSVSRAISEVRATSPRHFDEVERAVISTLEAKAYDISQVRDHIRKALK